MQKRDNMVDLWDFVAIMQVNATVASTFVSQLPHPRQVQMRLFDSFFRLTSTWIERAQEHLPRFVYNDMHNSNDASGITLSRDDLASNLVELFREVSHEVALGFCHCFLLKKGRPPLSP